MDCCAPDVDAASLERRTNDDELRLASRDIGGGLRQTELAIPGIHCGGCVQRIEKTLNKLPGVVRARVNLSTKRATIHWRSDETPPPFISTLSAIGFEAHLYDVRADDGSWTRVARGIPGSRERIRSVDAGAGVGGGSVA